jgi:hypothetical protein
MEIRVWCIAKSASQVLSLFARSSL